MKNQNHTKFVGKVRGSVGKCRKVRGSVGKCRKAVEVSESVGKSVEVSMFEKVFTLVNSVTEVGRFPNFSEQAHFLKPKDNFSLFRIWFIN